ncbi:galactose-1-phosphate uridylyltransferase [Micromonospora polyrhachis]|uniref:Galactose-1-phosphate uridylyltransferase n=1 Tax=Micromonospora polyrhachis TaxID=1282883 RepID=A0A7W7SX35_9ACTN|nr:galactose-1-phosphate uridylyltransferase [Micromonospora polyrhachis]MBB4962587.1 UDPglucose--hexose-1-phosphate uridylyltransferase [Micromonospora polyrhachis]
MKRTVAQLADGRELIYFDERDDSVRDAVDRRSLPPPPVASELRYDPVLDEWVAIAAHRQTRTHLPSSDECPLCPATVDRPSEIPASDYDVVVFENRFPAFSHRASDMPAEAVVRSGPAAASRSGAGRCEVVCFTAEHGGSFASLSPSRVRTVVEAWADRTAELSARGDVELVFCFENRGEEIGVTLHHPHGQIYGYPFVPPRVRRMLTSARRYAADRAGANLFADLLAAERATGERIVAENEHWTAFVPAAARWPYEVHLYPNRRVPDIPALTGPERDAFGPIYLDVLRRFDRLFGRPAPYISAWYQAPTRVDRDLAYLHLQVFTIRRAPGKLKYLAGSESAMGVFINDIRPEEAARHLREVAA